MGWSDGTAAPAGPAGDDGGGKAGPSVAEGGKAAPSVAEGGKVGGAGG
ncbi:hypothetical protein Aab01nite_75230 [Paractinoplanes abujensis]|nr:hypothetical protein Aab01nite_75230 [Actinoplanes abujensis]